MGYKVDTTVYSLTVEAGKTATLKVSDTPKVTDTLIDNLPAEATRTWGTKTIAEKDSDCPYLKTSYGCCH